jgi:DNA-binding HxlR family transcriptional regulator
MTLVLQRFARVSLLGIEVEARIDLADEPVIEAGDLGRLLEYKESYKCRELVRRLVKDGRLSGRYSHGGSTEKSADNSGLSHTALVSVATRGTSDVFVVTEREQVGTVVRDVDKLWLTERACLLVATASETERAWQVRTALVDFFMEHRRERTNPTALSSTVVHEVLAARDEMRKLADEVRAVEARVVQTMALDERLRNLEQKPGRKRREVVEAPVRSETSIETAVKRFLERVPLDSEVTIDQIANATNVAVNPLNERKIGMILSRLGWISRRTRCEGRQIRIYRRR